ncbi:hypothetical protein VP01_4403g1 [Puccinia sorghi]|uniref:Integrase catalytic domain-containing protein n=1 Tax=Puccinia sorghi TaxID=27349 RepID=A0A0L6UPL3_9BASI|nr:hypothetical protein VP01_4403g1 [Puccinia sorghi]
MSEIYLQSTAIRNFIKIITPQKLSIPGKDFRSCKACAVAKVTKNSFHTRHSRASKPFKQIHMDLVGPIFPSSREGHCYFLTVVDSSVSLKARRKGYFPTVIHSDRGTKFINSYLMDLCNKNLIRACQFNGTILESVRAILQDTGLNKRLWNEIIKTSALTLNQIPAHKSKSSPYELFKGRKLPLEFFKPVGNRVSYLILPEQQHAKLESKGLLGTLIGYNDELRSYRILGDNGRIIDTSHLKFLDPELPRNSIESNDSDLK